MKLTAVFAADVAICCHIFNVFGYLQMVKEISDFCQNCDVPLIVDDIVGGVWLRGCADFSVTS